MAGTPASNFEDPASNFFLKTSVHGSVLLVKDCCDNIVNGPYQLPCISFPVVLVFDTVMDSAIE
jgi:hypothetical protein